MTQTTFKRIETKYRIPLSSYEDFRRDICDFMTLDRYGLKTVMNIYYDTPGHELIGRSLEKPVYKEKLRLRSYGQPSSDTRVFAEIKKKYRGVVYKRRSALSLKEAEDFLDRGIYPEADSQINRELAYFLDHYQPRPAMVLCYDREAFYGKEDPELRLTLDRHIRFREEDLSLEEGDHGREVDPGYCLLEIKAAGAIPLFLTRLLSQYHVYQESFSKYGAAYKLSVAAH